MKWKSAYAKIFELNFSFKPKTGAKQKQSQHKIYICWYILCSGNYFSLIERKHLQVSSRVLFTDSCQNCKRTSTIKAANKSKTKWSKARIKDPKNKRMFSHLCVIFTFSSSFMSRSLSYSICCSVRSQNIETPHNNKNNRWERIIHVSIAHCSHCSQWMPYNSWFGLV